MKNTSTLPRPALSPARPPARRSRTAWLARIPRLPLPGATARHASTYCDVQGTQVRYVEAGTHNPGPPLLMVHGYNGSCDYFYPYALPGLAAERHVLAFDFPGSGWSGPWPSYTLDAYARFIPHFMDALGIDQADLLGHSMGGLVAMSTAAAHPRRFRKLVLVDSAGARPLKLGLAHSLRMLRDPSLWLFRMYPTFARVALKGRATREGLTILRAAGMEPAALSRFTLPTLIIWGERDHLVSPEHGIYLASHIPDAQHVVIKGAGHMPFYERPQEFSRRVLGFLR